MSDYLSVFCLSKMFNATSVYKRRVYIPTSDDFDRPQVDPTKSHLFTLRIPPTKLYHEQLVNNTVCDIIPPGNKNVNNLLTFL